MLETIKGVAEAAGGTMANVTFNTIFLKELADDAKMNAVYAGAGFSHIWLYDSPRCAEMFVSMTYCAIREPKLATGEIRTASRSGPCILPHSLDRSSRASSP